MRTFIVPLTSTARSSRFSADWVDALHGDETKNIAAQHPQEVDRMMTEIGKGTAAQNQVRTSLSRGPKATLDKQTIDRLRSLGYLGGN